MVDDLLLKSIFTSTARVELMTCFLRNSSKEIHMSMLKSYLGKNLSTYQKELDNLVKIGFLLQKRQGNLRLFRLNTSFVLIAELRRIFLKTTLMPEMLRYRMKLFTKIEYAFLYDKTVGSAAVRCLFVVCADDDNILSLSNVLSSLVRELGYALRVNVYHLSDIKRLSRQGDFDVLSAMNAEKTMVKEG